MCLLRMPREFIDYPQTHTKATFRQNVMAKVLRTKYMQRASNIQAVLKRVGNIITYVQKWNAFVQ